MPEPSIVERIAGLLLRLVLVAIGAVLAAAVLCLLMLVAAWWGLRYAWVRLTGRPVAPWAPRFDARGTWQRYTRPEAAASFRRRGSMAEAPRDVTDVDAK